MVPGRDSDKSSGADRIAILGAGSLGQLWAGHLPAGQAVFLSRASSLTTRISNEPSTLKYRLTLPEGAETQCEVPVSPVASIHPELLLVTTKAGDTPAALDQVLPDLHENVPVVLFQNGMGCQQAVADRWPSRPILAAVTTEGANRPEAGLLIHAGRGQTWVGGLTDNGRQCTASTVEQLSGSGLVVNAETDIHQRLWNKLVVNVGINAFTAILDCPNGDILADPFFLAHIEDLSEEISRVMAVEARQPLTAGEIRAQIHTVATRTANNTSSMRSDLQRGRKTEIDVINGYIADRGQAAGIATPVNQMLIRRVKELTEI